MIKQKHPRTTTLTLSPDTREQLKRLADKSKVANGNWSAYLRLLVDYADKNKVKV